MILKNHNKKFGLYRAAPTRFAGRVREVARLLRVKNDLQEVVVSAEYKDWVEKERKRAGKKTVAPAETEDNDETEEDSFDVAHGVDAVKACILDENGFWKVVRDYLQISTPIVQLLRLCDGNQRPAMGKVYDRMFCVSERIKKSEVDWMKDEAAEFVANRWEYMHSPMHSAGYVLDPEFLNIEDEHDSATQDGLFEIIRKIALRDVLACSKMPAHVAKEIIGFQHDLVQKRVSKIHLQLAKYQCKEGTFEDISVRNNAKEMSPGKWWKVYGLHMPELRSIATRVLSQPVSASASERNWSIYGQIKTKKR